MKRLLNEISLVAIMSLTFLSCSIKEDRTECPCILKVEFRQVLRHSVAVTGFRDGVLFSEVLDRDGCARGLEVAVPKTAIGVTCLSGAPVVGKGCEMDSLYAHYAVVDCTGEEAVDVAVMNKQFATVHLHIRCGTETEPCPYVLTVRGNVDGLCPDGLAPHDGVFEFSPPEAAPMYFEFRIPRQKDDSLILEMYRSSDGRLAETLPLGRMIAEEGFDWNEASLKDIVAFVDLSEVTTGITVGEWDAEKIYDVTI